MEYTVLSECCCFTGHRNLSKDGLYTAKLNVEKEVRRLYDQGVRYFFSGGALGFDMAASVAVQNLKSELKDIKLIIAQPCLNYNSSWTQSDRNHYESIFRLSDGVICVSNSNYFNGCMQIRDKYLVDNCGYMICWYDGRLSGGTLYTLNYARKLKREVTNVYTDKLIGYGK